MTQLRLFAFAMAGLFLQGSSLQQGVPSSADSIDVRGMLDDADRSLQYVANQLQAHIQTNSRIMASAASAYTWGRCCKEEDPECQIPITAKGKCEENDYVWVVGGTCTQGGCE